MKTQKINTSQIRIGNIIRTPHLPEGFIVRVINYKKKLAEIEKVSLEDTILNFQKDMHPETELRIWENISQLYEEFESLNNNLTYEAKREALGVLLVLSTGSKEIEKMKNLSEEQVNYLKNRYD